jgi:uncharacterized protein YhfF/catechol 2,3-dioxygenase-like lactoylglutathione lyase family enzyme
MIHFKRLDHIQLCIPIEAEDEARIFYGEILGLKEVPKPESLLKNGGLWFELADIGFHIGVEDMESAISKRHPAFEVENIKVVREYLISKNVTIKEDTEIPNIERFSIFDPWGNRIELLEKANADSEKIKSFWNSFIELKPEYKFYSIPNTDTFCNEENLTNELVELVRMGIKTASCGAVIDYQICGDPFPKVGELKIIVNWDKEPICITKITNVEVKKFKDITEEFARKEGEGDLSYAYWKQAHLNFFSNYLETLGLKFTDEMELVCEEFEKIY